VASPTAGSVSTADDSPAVEMRGITKRFPGVIANHDADLTVARGEVHALLGENGAGKSTLSNCLTGLYRPEQGTIRLWGKTVNLSSPKVAIEHGIGMVHQHFHLVQTFTVAENLSLGHSGRLNLGEAEERVAALAERYGLPVNPRARIWELTVGEQQRVEILKALDHEARVLILDEPTAVLTPQEALVLFETLRSMADEGRSVIFITHKLKEVLQVADRIAVLRGGKVMGEADPRTATQASLAAMMVGREVILTVEKTPAKPGDVVLATRELSAANDMGEPALTGVTLAVRAGEVLGVAGVQGNGQTELVEVITGLRRAEGGQGIFQCSHKGSCEWKTHDFMNNNDIYSNIMNKNDVCKC